MKDYGRNMFAANGLQPGASVGGPTGVLYEAYRLLTTPPGRIIDVPPSATIDLASMLHKATTDTDRALLEDQCREILEADERITYAGVTVLLNADHVLDVDVAIRLTGGESVSLVFALGADGSPTKIEVFT